MTRRLIPAFSWLLVFVFLVGGAEAAVFDADGNPIPIGKLATAKINWRPLESTDAVSGVGILVYPSLLGSLDTCTIFLVDTKRTNGPAYLFSNAHCTLHALGLKPLDSKEARVDEETDFVASFRRLKGVSAADHLTFKLKVIAYYTENGTDLALFKAQDTLGDFIRQGIHPLKLSGRKAKTGMKLMLIGAPLLRVPDAQHFLHTSSCQMLGEASIQNGDYRAPHSAIHNCSSMEGFSGSPLLDPKTREVYLLNSHGASGDSKDPDCSYASQPCEVGMDGKKVVHLYRNYAQYLDSVANCFDGKGELALDRINCRLPKP